MILNKASLRSLSPVVSASHCIISLEKKNLEGLSRPPFGLFGEIDWDSMKMAADGEGGGVCACCFHSAKNIAVVLNTLTGEQQNTISLTSLFSWCDSPFGRRLPSKELAAQQRKRLEYHHFTQHSKWEGLCCPPGVFTW